jgi:hypothetical protein
VGGGATRGTALPVIGRDNHRTVRSRGSHIFKTFGSHMAVRLSVLRTGRTLPTPPHEDSWYAFRFEAESTTGR